MSRPNHHAPVEVGSPGFHSRTMASIEALIDRHAPRLLRGAASPVSPRLAEVAGRKSWEHVAGVTYPALACTEARNPNNKGTRAPAKMIAAAWRAGARDIATLAAEFACDEAYVRRALAERGLIESRYKTGAKEAAA